MPPRLAWVTTRAARGHDLDEPLGLRALARRGAIVDVVDWSDPDVAWDSYDRVALRSTWDYQEQLPAFLAWVEETARRSDLRNPPPLIRWSSDKHYLDELSAAGVPVPSSTFFPHTDPVDLVQLSQLTRGPVIVKPAVGAGSRGVAAYAPGETDLAAAHIARLHARGRSVLVQPRLASVARDGERALVYFGGTYSHAATKRVTLPHPGTVDELFAAEHTTPHEATPAELAVAGAAMDLVSEKWGTPAYARVDLVRDDDGDPCVLELELVEPSLFLAEGSPSAADRLAAALLA